MSFNDPVHLPPSSSASSSGSFNTVSSSRTSSMTEGTPVSVPKHQQPTKTVVTSQQTHSTSRDVFRKLENVFIAFRNTANKAWGKVTGRNDMPDKLGNGAKHVSRLVGSDSSLFTNKTIGSEGYSGQLKGGLAHGKGAYTEVGTDGSTRTYVGKFKKGKPVGQGDLYVKFGLGDASKVNVTWPKGQRGEGRIPKGEWIGKMTLKSGVLIEGEFKGNKLEGSAFISDPKNRTAIAGSFKDNRLVHGNGNQKYEDGSYYEGEFGEDFVFEGKGTYVTPEGYAYTGIREDGVLHGTVFVTDPEGRTSSGRYDHGELVGSLTPVDEDWTPEEFEFAPPNEPPEANSAEQPESLPAQNPVTDPYQSIDGTTDETKGPGLLRRVASDGLQRISSKIHHPSRTSRGPDWKSVELEPPADTSKPYPVKQEGKFKNGLLEGKGILKFSNGDQVAGMFKGGVFQAGKGAILYAPDQEDDRVSYKGELNAEGKPHGKGVLVTKNGDVFRSGFVNGEMVGKGTVEITQEDSDGNKTKQTLETDDGTYLEK